MTPTTPADANNPLAGNRVVAAVTVETYRAKTFTIELPRWLPFRAGQHYDVRLNRPRRLSSTAQLFHCLPAGNHRVHRSYRRRNSRRRGLALLPSGCGAGRFH